MTATGRRTRPLQPCLIYRKASEVSKPTAGHSAVRRRPCVLGQWGRVSNALRNPEPTQDLRLETMRLTDPLTFRHNPLPPTTYIAPSLSYTMNWILVNGTPSANWNSLNADPSNTQVPPLPLPMNNFPVVSSNNAWMHVAPKKSGIRTARIPLFIRTAII